MTESTVSVKPKEQQGFFEDLIDIFVSPVGVFERAQHRSVWPPLLFVSLAIGIIFFVTFNTLEPIFDAEFQRNMAQAAAKAGRPMPPEALENARKFGLGFTRYGISLVMFVSVLVLGLVAWIVGKLVGSKQTLHAAMVVAAWSYMPRVLGAVLAGVQGLVLDSSTMPSQFAISLVPARFFDPEKTNALLLQVLGRFDLLVIWETVLLAIGLYVTGKVSTGRAVAFGFLVWIVGSLPMIRAGLMAM